MDDLSLDHLSFCSYGMHLLFCSVLCCGVIYLLCVNHLWRCIVFELFRVSSSRYDRYGIVVWWIGGSVDHTGKDTNEYN